MSRKSRQPDAGGTGRGRKGKKGASTEAIYTEVVVEEPGVPFGLVVLIALVLSLPALVRFMDGTVDFRPAIMRVLGSLMVSWLMCQLVHSVITSFATKEETTVLDTRAEGRDVGDVGDDPYRQDRAAS
ncbi:hypothetical protein [Mobilicoccus sp.]|uniref:hypothetical protein n=1 Tax=Mobilicoccus sp. TaxID=2034349 RepID=UPI0028A868DE|nr:hypothetical protein [Mobilicoccus sp.]